MKKNYLSLLAAPLVATLFAIPASAKIAHLLPLPHQVTATGGTLTLPTQVSIDDVRSTPALMRFVSEFGSQATFSQTTDAHIRVRYVAQIAGSDDHALAGYDNEAYRLEVTPQGILIEAVSQTGVVRAAQTLTQMAEGWDETGKLQLECAHITDWAAFKVRGYMHDVGRSYISVATLKKHIRLLSRFKINTFHWHLTENQAWRFEVKHPDYAHLTQARYMAASRFPGQFYTQAECREVEQYAREHGVTVIPEIDMPGHSEAFERALGYTMQSDKGTQALKQILNELADAFPQAPYIHIGADEKTIERLDWLNGMVDYVKKTLGRRCALWNPIRNIAVANTRADLTQMWGTAGKVVAGKANIDSRYNYTNHFDVYADLVGIYKSNVYYEQKGNAAVAGAISAAWNDRLTPTEDDIIRQNNFYANVIATGVRAWAGGGQQYIDNMTNGGTNGHGGTTLPNSGAEYDDFAQFEARFLFHKAHSLAEDAHLIPYVKQTHVRWLITDAFPNGGNKAAVFPPEEHRNAEILPSSFTYNGKAYATRLATGAGIYLRHTWGPATINSFYSAPAFNQTAYAWTYVYSPTAQEVGAQLEFYNYSRSEKDAVPTSGWDFYGSRIWLNDSEIPAPSYDNAGKTITNEHPLANENFTGRPLTKLSLRKGWNKVFLKLPYVDAPYRLDKWMFTCVFTDPTGLKAAEDLVYSPYQQLDEDATLLRATMAEAKQRRAAYVGEEVGYYPAAAAEQLDAAITATEQRIEQGEMSEAERQTLIQNLRTAVQNFEAGLRTQAVVQPDPHFWYNLSTPQRSHRYAASKGVNQALVGETSASQRTAWRFERRNDGSWDIISSDGSFLAPTAAHNSPLTTSATSPTQGWTVSAAATLGCVIITSGNAQLNQTNAGLGWKIYNWGGGTNTTDTGCQYLVRRSAYQNGITAIASLSIEREANTYDLLGRRTTATAPGVYIVNGTTIVK